MDKIKELVLGILTWVGESAFRLFAVIILAICTMVGWFVYTEKDSFMASYRAQQALPRMNGNYEGASNFIFKNSNISNVLTVVIDNHCYKLFMSANGVELRSANGVELSPTSKAVLSSDGRSLHWNNGQIWRR